MAMGWLAVNVDYWLSVAQAEVDTLAAEEDEPEDEPRSSSSVSVSRTDSEGPQVSASLLTIHIV